jgi:predicted ATPase/DNA-binding CsgD family transcriptional regulator
MHNRPVVARSAASPVRLVEREAVPFSSVPRPLTTLVGREQVSARVLDLLRRPEVRLLTLTGPGGVGKTRLAIEVATRWAEEIDGEVAFVALAPLTDPQLVVPAIAQAVGVREAGEQPLTERLTAALCARTFLLVLDNCEQVLDSALHIGELLVACPRLMVLATSRAPLRLSGEREYPVPPLSLPPEEDGVRAGRHDGQVLRLDVEQSEAVRLFAERARTVLPTFALTADNAERVAEICRRLDGLPLAIELAAARVKLFPPATLLARLERRLPVLIGGPRDAPARQQTLRDAIAWSYDLLAPDEQKLFRRLAVFVGGFTFEAAEYVGGAANGGISVAHAPLPADVARRALPSLHSSVADGLGILVDANMVRRDDAAGGKPGPEPRYAMLETVREFGLEALEAVQEDATVRAAHAAFYLDLAEKTEWDLARGRADRWLDRLAIEQDDLRAALEWFEHAGEPETFLRMAHSLWVWWLFRGPYAEGRAWLERALALGAEAPAPLRCKVLFVLGHLAVNQGDVHRSEACFTESLAIGQSHADRQGIANGWLGIGFAAMHRLQFVQATQHFKEALAGARRIDDRALAGVCGGLALSYLGACAYAMDALPLATSRFQEALLEQRAVDDRWGIGFSLIGSAYAAREQGDVEQAVALFGEGLARFVELGDRRMVALALEGIAGLAGRWQQAELAARLFAAAAAVQEASGLPIEPAYRAAHGRGVDAARASLGEPAFAAAWGAGAALSLEQAVAEATAIAALRPNAASDAPSSRQGTPFDLTPRELDVLRLLADGRSDKEIGAALFISHRTAMNHVSRILAKLDVPSRAVAAREATRRGFL